MFVISNNLVLLKFRLILLRWVLPVWGMMQLGLFSFYSNALEPSSGAIKF